MRRPHIYYVGGDKATYNREDWAKLQAALCRFHEVFYGGEAGTYTCSPLDVAERSTFPVYRADHKPLTLSERAAIGMYFHGVCVAYGIEKGTDRTA